MTIDRTLRSKAHRRKTLAACLAAALAAAGAGAAGIQHTANTRAPADSDEAIFGGLHTRMPSRVQRPWHLADRRLAKDSGAHPAGVFLPVENCLDDGSDGSLRQVFSIAQDGDTIDLSALDNCPESKITLATGAIAIEAPNLTVLGPGQNKLTIDGANSDRIFQSKYYGLTISDVTIANGFAASGFGGCIDIAGGANLSLTRSTITGCRAGDGNNQDGRGGGVYVEGALYLSSSTISANTAEATDSARGGGAFADGDIFLTFSTLSANLASSNCTTCYNRNRGGGAYATGLIFAYYSTVSSNTVVSTSSDGSAQGGGLATNDHGSWNALRLLDSTISGNHATATVLGEGGGIWVADEGSFWIANSTVAFNEASTSGGGIHAGDGGGNPTFFLDSTIISNNQSPNGADVGTNNSLSSIQGGHNLVMLASANVSMPADTLTSDPLLQTSLAFNGGSTATHALDPLSPAIDGGDNSNVKGGLAYDQRGCPYTRVAGAAADIGAFELHVEPLDYLFGDGFDNELLCP